MTNPPNGHCRAQHHALQYYSSGPSTMIIPETVLSEAQEYDWAKCYDEIERWHTPTPEADAARKSEQGKQKVEEKVRVYKGSDEVEGAKLWCLKEERNGVCLGCGGKRVAARG